MVDPAAASVGYHGEKVEWKDESDGAIADSKSFRNAIKKQLALIYPANSVPGLPSFVTATNQNIPEDIRLKFNEADSWDKVVDIILERIIQPGLHLQP